MAASGRQIDEAQQRLAGIDGPLAPGIKRRLVWLVVVHALVGVAAAGLVALRWWPIAAETLFISVFFAQAGLVGLWAGLGRHGKLAGYAGVAVALLGLAAVAVLALWQNVVPLQSSARSLPGYDAYVMLWICLLLMSLAMMALACIVGVSLWLNARNIHLRRLDAANAASCPDALRFSVKQMMGLVLVVAVLLKLGPVAQARLSDYNSYLVSAVAVCIFGLCLGAGPLAAVWAALGQGRPLGRMALAVGVGAVVGLLPPFYVPNFSTHNFAASSAVFALQAAIVSVSLLVVRGCGYRLVVTG